MESRLKRKQYDHQPASRAKWKENLSEKHLKKMCTKHCIGKTFLSSSAISSIP